MWLLRTYFLLRIKKFVVIIHPTNSLQRTCICTCVCTIYPVQCVRVMNRVEIYPVNEKRRTDGRKPNKRRQFEVSLFFWLIFLKPKKLVLFSTNKRKTKKIYLVPYFPQLLNGLITTVNVCVQHATLKTRAMVLTFDPAWENIRSTKFTGFCSINIAVTLTPYMYYDEIS